MEQCSTCTAWGVKQQKEMLRPHEAPKLPGEKIGIDLFHFNDRDYMVTVEYLSNFWEVDHLEKTQSKNVIPKPKTHFARYGIPDILYSDNGPQYSFSKACDFNHKTQSPEYTQSNEKVELTVKTAKRLMAKGKRALTHTCPCWITEIPITRNIQQACNGAHGERYKDTTGNE